MAIDNNLESQRMSVKEKRARSIKLRGGTIFKEMCSCVRFVIVLFGFMHEWLLSWCHVYIVVVGQEVEGGGAALV